MRIAFQMLIQNQREEDHRLCGKGNSEFIKTYHEQRLQHINFNAKSYGHASPLRFFVLDSHRNAGRASETEKPKTAWNGQRNVCACLIVKTFPAYGDHFMWISLCECNTGYRICIVREVLRIPHGHLFRRSHFMLLHKSNAHTQMAGVLGSERSFEDIVSIFFLQLIAVRINHFHSLFHSFIVHTWVCCDVFYRVSDFSGFFCATESLLYQNIILK